MNVPLDTSLLITVADILLVVIIDSYTKFVYKCYSFDKNAIIIIQLSDPFQLL